VKNNDKPPRTPKPRWEEKWNIKFKTIVCRFSFEEEQEELKKSLSKDWCDKMDNEEAEEKKLHR
jgi:hypothetical protein